MLKYDMYHQFILFLHEYLIKSCPMIQYYLNFYTGRTVYAITALIQSFKQETKFQKNKGYYLRKALLQITEFRFKY